MKNTTQLIAAAGILVLTMAKANALPIGDSAELFFTGNTGVRTDSNVYLTANKTSDTIFNVDPGLELKFGSGSSTTGTFDIGENFNIYSDHSGLNSDLTSGAFNTAYEDGKTKVSVNTSYDELDQNTVDVLPVVGAVPGLIRRNVFGAGGNGEIAVTEKTTITGGVQYANTDYRRANYDSNQVVTLPFDFYYEVTPKLDVGLGYRYRSTWQDFGPDSHDQFFSLAARGEFTPKLTGSVNVGITQRDFTTRSSASLLGIDSNLMYAATPKVSVQFGVSNDFDTNALGQEEKNLSFQLSATAQVNDQWNFTTALIYRSIDYFTRTDNYYEGQVGLSYIVNNHVSLSGAIAYRKYDSGRDQAETTDAGAQARTFDDTVLSVAANFRF